MSSTYAELVAKAARQAGYEGPWPQTRGHMVPRAIAFIAQRYPLRATVPAGSRVQNIVMNLAGAGKPFAGRLAFSETCTASGIWVWARDAEAASAATRACTALQFAGHDGSACDEVTS